MRNLLLAGAAIAALAFPATSRAQLQLGLRVGYGGASGDAFKDKADGSAAKMSDAISSQVPLQLDAMYRVTPEVRVGAYFSYGFVQLGGDAQDQCDATGVDCSTHEYRLGAQATYAFTKVSPVFVPWAGLGVGYEWSSFKIEEGGVTFEQSFHGFEFATLQLGGDYKVNERFSVGPYATYSFAQYSGGEEKVTIGGASGTRKFSDFADEAIHQWWSVGIAGKFDL